MVQIQYVSPPNFWLALLFSQGASNLNQSCRDDFFMMSLGFCHVIQVQGSSGFDFLPTKIPVPWLVGQGQLGWMTESLRYLSWSREASPIGPSVGLGLLYGPWGTQLEGGNSFLMGKLRLLLYCLINKLDLQLQWYSGSTGISHFNIKGLVFEPFLL